MNKTRRTKSKYLLYAAILLIIVFLVSSALFVIEIVDRGYSLFPEQDYDYANSVITYNNQEYVLKDDIETVLVMGVDKFEDTIDDSSYNNNQQADFLMLLIIDNANAECSAIHINRDTITDINVLGVAGEKVGTVNRQIALAHTYGNGKEVSCRNTSDAVSALLNDIKIDHYVSLTMDSIAVFNDLVGGVEVAVLDNFTGVDDTLIQGENVTLYGEHALNYVRSRYGMDDSSNNNRMMRQRQYIEALIQKTKQCVEKDESFIVDTSLEMAEYIVSDFSTTKFQNFAEKISEYNFTEIHSIEGEIKIGDEFVEFYPDEDALDALVVQMFYEPK